MHLLNLVLRFFLEIAALGRFGVLAWWTRLLRIAQMPVQWMRLKPLSYPQRSF